MTILRAGNVEYSLKTTKQKTPEINGFQLMGVNVIELIKKLASDTGHISKEKLCEKSTEEELIKEYNEAYRLIFID